MTTDVKNEKPSALRQKAQEAETICRETVEDKSTEKKSLLNTDFWKSIACVVVQVTMLRSLSDAGADKHDAFADCSVVYPIVATVLYISGVIYGKKWMRDREPFQLSESMITYNVYQTIMNLWWVVSVGLEVRRLGMNFWGSEVDRSPQGFRLGFFIWLHYQNKYVELLDTVFMVLRKKNNQISFLHCYHHCLLIWSWFVVCKFACGGDAWFGSSVNSFVHVLMYGYYLMALLRIPCPWKRHITNLQMLQFVTCAVHSFYVLRAGTYPAWITLLQLFVMVNMLVLFGNFYMKTYLQKGAKKAQ